MVLYELSQKSKVNALQNQSEQNTALAYKQKIWQSTRTVPIRPLHSEMGKYGVYIQ
jgi:hypothetical protein